MIDDRWEHGSEFHWLDPGTPGEDAERAWLLGLDARSYASGRASLQALVEHGGWSRVWLPSYVCEELAVAVGARLRFYADDPSRTEPTWPDELAAGDAIVRVNYFGLRGFVAAAQWRARGVVVIDDHTHDPCGPWARASDADYCLASLRKSLPLPDGALLWSPRAAALPEQAAADARAAAKLAPMLLKALYLAGHDVDKPSFRALAIDGERSLGELGLAAMSAASAGLLRCLAISQLRRRRRENYQAFAHALGGRVELLHAVDDAIAPFACVLRLADREQRDRVRQALIDGRIYPAVLWPLDEHERFEAGFARRFAAARELSERLLSLHCDARYTPADMQRVANVVNGQLG